MPGDYKMVPPWITGVTERLFFMAGGLYLYYGLDAHADYRAHPGHEQLTAFVQML